MQGRDYTMEHSFTSYNRAKCAIKTSAHLSNVVQNKSRSEIIVRRVERKIMKALAYLVGVVLVVGFGIGMWQLARTWNYNLSYKSMVKQTIVEMVKEESLKNPPKAK